jgi:D-3-phosphoglycerate dehydrogenase
MNRLKHIIYLEYLAHPAFEHLVTARADVRLHRLTNAMPVDAAEALLREALVYQIPATRDEVGPRYRADRGLFARAPNLLIVSSSGAGYDTIELAECTASGVLALNQAGGNREAVAEHALGMMLCLSKRMIQSDRAMRRAQIVDRHVFMGHDLFGKTIGIVGLGAVGSRVAELCRGLFAMRVLAFDPYLTPSTIAARGAEAATLPELLSASDVVSLHCPLTAKTAGLIGAAEFALMAPGALFITTARGGIHDEDALVAALRAGTIAGAGLDVWSREPPPPDHLLLGFDNVIATAHTAGVTHEARRNIATIAAEQILGLFDGKSAPRVLNPEVWDSYVARAAGVFGPWNAA